MTNSKLLKIAIMESGFKIGYIAERLDITYQGLKNKVENKTEFKASEIRVLCDVLKIEGDRVGAIFFGDCVD